jgi:glycosyltransferase involved in cell wall biosynthesis
MSPVSDSFREQVLVADSLLEAGELDRALAVGEKLLGENPDYVPLLRVVGYAALGSENLELARECFVHASKLDKNRLRALASLATVYKKEGKWRKARRTYRRILESGPSSAPEHQKRVEAALNLQDVDQILWSLTEALRAFPDDPEYSADWTERRDELRDAITAFEAERDGRGFLRSIDATGPKVLMLLFTTYENDARVDRTATTLARSGYHVVLLARYRMGLPFRETRNGYTVVRSPSVDGRDRAVFDYLRSSANGASPFRALLARGRSRLRRLFSRRSDPDSIDLGLDGGTDDDPDFAGRRAAYARFARVALEYARDYRPDIVHAHDFNTLVAAFEIRKALEVPYVYDTHELWVHRNRVDVPYSDAEIRWEERFEKRAMRGAAFSITVGDRIAEHLREQYGVPRPVVVRNTPERRRPTRAPNRDIRKAVGVSRDDFLAIYVGRFTFYRGLGDILEALPHCDPRIHVVMLGYFDRRFRERFFEKLQRLDVADRVHFYGPVDTSEVADWVAGADLSLTTMNRSCLSYVYTLPNKLFESLQAECPVLGPDSPEIVDILDRYDCGETYRDGEPLDLAEKLDRFLREPERLRRLKEGAKRAGEELCWQNERERLLGAYREWNDPGAGSAPPDATRSPSRIPVSARS